MPIAGNLAAVWLIVEATTAASALLVAFSGRRDALEAGWKYLLLTTLGLSVALLGIIILAIGQANAGHHGLHALDWHALQAAAHALPKTPTLIAFVLLLAGLATKIGWAPVHNWLPDAHSEAPAPISALLSAALLPSACSVAWRVKEIAPAVGRARPRRVTCSSRSAWPRCSSRCRSCGDRSRGSACSPTRASSTWASSRIGIGFGTPLAIAGVVLHVAGHALAKALGFYAALPLLRIDPKAANKAPETCSARAPPRRQRWA